MKTIIFSFSIIFLVNVSTAQNCDWINGDEVGNDSYITGISNDSNNVFITGYYKDTFTLDNQQVIANGGRFNSYIALVDSNGNSIWIKSYGDNGYHCKSVDITCDDLGNSYTLGHYEESLTIGTSNFTSPIYSDDVFIIKLDINGNVVWAHEIKNSTSKLEALSIEVGTSGVFVYVHASSDSTIFNNIISSGRGLIAKYNFNGQIQWVKDLDKLFGGEMVITEHDDVIVTGRFSDTLDLTDTLLVSLGHWQHITPVDSIWANTSDIALLSLDSSGNRNWIHSFKSKYNIYNPQGLHYDMNGNIFIFSNYPDSTYYDDGTLLPNSGNYNKTFIAKFDILGTMLWVEEALTENGLLTDITTDGSTLYMTGNTNSNIPLIRYDMSGNYLSTFKTGGPNNDYGRVINTYRGKLLLGGVFYESIDFGNCNLSNNSFGFNAFLVKVNGLITSIKYDSYNKTLKIYPNPTNNQLTIGTEQEILNIEIIDITGKLIMTTKQISNVVNVSNLLDGIYFIKLITEEITTIKKFVKQ